MVELTIRGDKLRLQVKGLDRLWAMRSRLDIPLSCVRGIRADPTVARGVWKGVSAPGTHIPGIIIAGTFRPWKRARTGAVAPLPMVIRPG